MDDPERQAKYVRQGWNVTGDIFERDPEGVYWYVDRGDDMIVTGRVTRKFVHQGEHRVDIDVMISNQERPATPCEATVALPSRDAATAAASA